MEILLIVVLVIIGIVAFQIGKTTGIKDAKDLKIEIAKQSNEKVLQERKVIESEIRQAKQRLSDIEQDYQSKRKLIDEAKELAENEYKEKKKAYLIELKTLKDKLDEKYAQDSQEYIIIIDELKQSLASLKKQKAASIEALQREQAIQEQKDLYRLALSNQDKQDIEFLRSIQFRISKPRLVSMLIWQNYVQPIAKKKLPLILGSENICGIYKITNIKNQMCYIGQAKDMRKRLNEHLKKGLGIDTPQGNKLYQAMLEDGIDNFTFELLEECSEEELNSKERYYIELYNSIDYGYNSQSGVKS